MPTLVPVRPDDPASEANRRAWAFLGQWDRPFLTAFSDSDPITGGMDAILVDHVPGAQSVTVARAGHFLQEDAGEELGTVVAAFIASSG